MTRIDELRLKFDTTGIDAFLVRKLPNVRYLSGFSGSAGSLLITNHKNYFVTDFRYKTQSATEVDKAFEVIVYTQNSLNFLKDIIQENGLRKIGFEADYVTFAEANLLKKDFPEAEFVPMENTVESITVKKNAAEIELTKKAVEITDKVFLEVLNIIKPGITERQVSAHISFFHKMFGADGDSFDAIVAAGERSAFPHARPTDRIIREGELVKLDFGCTFSGMKSDMTRTIAIGRIPDECMKIYEIVREAQRRALESVKAGMHARAVDAVARDFIKENGYGSNFGHGLGHGLGYDIHEKPALNERSEYVLEENNIITIEPGIYVEGLGGVRIEDDIVVTKEGCEILNKSPKELIVL
ncbi:MAG: Xaa-Pro peptidase family protein [Ignavibacteria bacterium]